MTDYLYGVTPLTEVYFKPGCSRGMTERRRSVGRFISYKVTQDIDSHLKGWTGRHTHTQNMHMQQHSFGSMGKTCEHTNELNTHIMQSMDVYNL